MGAQSAALLLAGGPLGDPPQPFDVAVTEQLTAPEGWSLDQVARSHGGVGLAPFSYDLGVLSTVLPGGVRARVLPSLSVELSEPADLGPLRRILDLETDLTELWRVAPEWTGHGWLLRASSPFEALVQALAATNTSYRSSQAMVRELVGTGPFPTPAAVLDVRPQRWGYRLPSLLALAERVDDTDWDGLGDDDLLVAVRRLRGFGAYAAASVLPLLGRPRPLVLDGWLASQVPHVGSYEVYGRWAGSVLWLDVSSRWLGICRSSTGP